ncbi:hypothetical protein MASR1M68_17020 [Elusimicrobiota bacterium]
MKRILAVILFSSLLFSSGNIPFAFDKERNDSGIFSGISNAFKIQYDLYQKTRYTVVNICDIVVRNISDLKVKNHNKIFFITEQTPSLNVDQILLLPNNIILLTKVLSTNHRIVQIPITGIFVLLFILMFLLMYLGLLRVFWIKLHQLNIFKKAYVLCMLSFIFNKKTVSIFTVICFLFSVLTSNLSASVLQDDLGGENNKLFSSKFGKVTEKINNNSDLLVVNIQDLHSNSSVQLNINNILGAIDKQYKIKQIFIEGAYGDTDISWLYKIQDTNIRNNLVEALLKNGRLTGAEYFAYKTKQKDILKGLEDEQIHKDNLKRLAKIIDKQIFYKSKLKKIKSDIDFVNAKYSSSKNLRLNKIVAKYNNGDIDAVKFYKLLFKLSKDINHNPQNYDNIFPIDLVNYPNINKYVNLNPEKINGKKLSAEINLFLELIKTKISYSLYGDIIKNTNNFADTNTLLQYMQTVSETHKIDLKRFYPSLYAYINTNISANSINPVELLNEERILLNNLRQAFSKNNTEYEVTFLADFYNVFKNYLTNNLTANEYDYFSDKIDKFKDIYSKYTVVSRLKDLASDFNILDTYYGINNQRNNIFINNMLAGKQIEYAEQDLGKDIFKHAKEIIVVVAGGYHTKGLGELLRDKKISYITITPNVEGNIAQSEQNYKNIVKEEINIETNALSFTVASSTNDFNQFKWAVVSGIKALDSIYSKELIEKVVESMKPLLKENIVLNFTETKAEIIAGDRKIVLLNHKGKIRSDTDEEIFQETENEINGFSINTLFEKYPVLNFSDGLEFKLRDLDKFGITEIKGIDLSVIARLPVIFQEYLYETLPDNVKSNAEELNRLEIIKEHDKTYLLYEELISMFIERIQATDDYMQFLDEILQMHIEILNDRKNDRVLFLDPLKKQLSGLLTKNISRTQYTYVTAILFYIYVITDDFDNTVSLTDGKNNINLLKDFMGRINLAKADIGVLVDKEIQNGRLLLRDREKRINELVDIIYSKSPPASILGGEYKNTAHIWEWIYNLPFSSFISSFIKKHGIKSIAEKEVFEQSISLGKKPALTMLFDSISSFSSIAGIGFGILTGTLPLVALSVLVYSVSRGIVFSISHGKVTDQKEKIKLAGLGTGFALLSAIPVIIGLSVLPVITPFLLVIGQLLSAQIHKLYKPGLLNHYVNGVKIKTSHIIAAVLIIATLVAGTMVVNNYYTKTYTEYVQIQQEIINIQSDRFEIIFSGYLKNTHLTAQEKAGINTLRDFFASNIDRSSHDKFLESLLYIKTQITSTDSVLTPSIDAGFSLYVWKDVVQDLDEMISDNLAEIQKNKNLNKMLSKSYGGDEISYLEILSLRDDSESLIKIVNGQKDIHYRFYAYMLLNAKDKTPADGFFDKDETLKYLNGQYILRDPLELIDINNSFQWQAVCGMMNFITGAGEDYSSILHDARVVRSGGPQISNAGLAYVISNDGVTSPIFVAAHEVAHIRFLNILGIHENTNSYKISELYAELEAVQIESKVSLQMQYTGNKTIKDINETTDEYSIAYIVIEEIRKAVGIDSANLLQDSIIEFLQVKQDVPAEGIKTTLKDVIEIFAGKIADREISEGTITQDQREEKIKEIIDRLIGSVSADTASTVSYADSLKTTPLKTTQTNPFAFMGLFFAGTFLKDDKKKKLMKYKNIGYVINEFEKQPMFLKRFYKIKFKEDENGITASYKHGIFSKPETTFISYAISKEEAYTLIRGLITEYLPTDLKGNVHYYTQFFKRDIRKTIYAPLFKHNENGQYGFVKEILKDKIAKGDRIFRFWSCGSATGEELRTFIWLVRKTLNELGENINDWKLDFYGTDNNKTTAEIASNFKGNDYIDDRELTVDTSGFNIRYVILDHTNMTDLSNWLIWQKGEGGFDLICQLNNPTPHEQQDAVAKEVMHPHSLYIHHNVLYDSFNKLKDIDKSFIENADTGSFLSDTYPVKPQKKVNARVRNRFSIFKFLKSLPDSILNIFTVKNEKPQKTGVVYRQIFADNIIYNDAGLELIDDVIYTNIFVVKGIPDSRTIQKLNLRPAGIEINGNGLYIGLMKNTVYLYAGNSSYDDIVDFVKDSNVINEQITANINVFYGKKLEKANLDIVSVKLINGREEIIKQHNNGVIEVVIPPYTDMKTAYKIMGSYIDVAGRYGFVVKESIFRYMDDFNIGGSKNDRISGFINIIEQQKNISCRLVLNYETYEQLVADIGFENFNDILNQAKLKNVSVYVLVDNNIQKNEIKKNTSLFGFIEIENDKYMITDSFTNDTTEALFGADSDTVQKIIAIITYNVEKQPIIFKNSLLKKAVNAEQDNTLAGILKDIFALGKVHNVISAVKSKHFAKKIAQTYSIKNLSQSFDDEDIAKLVKLYGDYISVSAENQNIKLKIYKEIISILIEKNSLLQKYFTFNNLTDDTQTSKDEMFLEQIIFRIAAANELAKHGKETGLKNTEYENVLAQAIKIQVLNGINSLDDEIDNGVAIIESKNSGFERERLLAEYLENNIGTLTQRAFSSIESDPKALNTLIFLIPFAQANDIEFDLTGIAVSQNDIMINTKAILHAA